jgi:hypothetical protein
MGDVVRLMTVIPVITFVKGDAKSGDTLVSRFGGKTCIARVPRMCLCGKADLDNPLHRCLWIQMAYQRALKEKVTQLSVPPETSECFINGMPNILVVKVTSLLVVDTLKVFTASFFRFQFKPTLGTMRLRAVPFISKKWYVPSFCVDPAIICGVNILAPCILTNAPTTK